MSPLNRRVAGLLVLLLALPAGARDVGDLYSARVPVPDRGAESLAAGARAALGRVLVKLTGNRAAASGPALGELGGSAAKLMLQYGFEPDPVGGGVLLAAHFDESALNGELERLGVPVWGKERPETVVWLVVDEGARRLVSGDEPGVEGEVVYARAGQRGLPALLPLMDIEESQHLLYAGDWQTLATTATALSTRYGTPATLVGHLVQSVPGLWEANWRVTVGEDSHDWRDEGDVLPLLLEAGVETLADALARRFADPALLGRDEVLAIRIVGLGSAADYARATTYLEALDTIADLFISEVSAAGVTVAFTARGGRTAFEQSVTFGNVLLPVQGQPGIYQLAR